MQSSEVLGNTNPTSNSCGTFTHATNQAKKGNRMKNIQGDVFAKKLNELDLWHSYDTLRHTYHTTFIVCTMLWFSTTSHHAACNATPN